MGASLEVADIFRRYGDCYRLETGAVSLAQRRVMTAIAQCRTAALGGHVEQCDRCQHVRVWYNSCRNRHCPKCQSLARAQWIEQREAEIAAAETLRTIAGDPKHLGAQIGFFAVLHTWGQQLQHHPHVHCVVTGGGLSRDGTHWIACRPGFFLPVRVLSRLFRRLFLQYLQQAFDVGRLRLTSSLEPLADPATFTTHLARTREIEWVVYAKRPFAGPRQVLDYVGRYTHRVAISNNRLVDLTEDQVRFRWKDYRAESQVKTITLAATEFLRRFLLHVLPSGFQRIRYYGLLGNRHRAEKLAHCRVLLGMAHPATEPSVASATGDYRDRLEALTGVSLRTCPVCHDGQMVPIIVDVGMWSAPAIVNTS